jgi:exonuclease III
LLILLCGDIEENPGPELNGFSIFHVNVRSLRNKIDLLETHQLKPDILAITESHLDQSFSSDKIELNGYCKNPYRKDKILGSGGICVYFNNTVYCERLDQFESDNLEILWVRVRVKNWSCIMGTVYRNPNLLVEYWDRLNNNISSVVDVYGSNNIIIIGDLNEDLLNDRLRHLKNTISMFAFQQFVTEPMRITETSETPLDPFICGNDVAHNVYACHVLPNFCSDHCPIFVVLKTNHEVRRLKRNVWLFHQADWDLFKSEVVRQNLLSLFNFSVDQITNRITTAIRTAAKKGYSVQKCFI